MAQVIIEITWLNVVMQWAVIRWEGDIPQIVTVMPLWIGWLGLPSRWWNNCHKTVKKMQNILYKTITEKCWCICSRVWGVRSHGSAVLLCVYLDGLLKAVCSAGVGCFISAVFTGILAYADDIVLFNYWFLLLSICIGCCWHVRVTRLSSACCLMPPSLNI